jgi:hypothetical protein
LPAISENLHDELTTQVLTHDAREDDMRITIFAAALLLLPTVSLAGDEILFTRVGTRGCSRLGVENDMLSQRKALSKAEFNNVWIENSLINPACIEVVKRIKMKVINHYKNLILIEPAEPNSLSKFWTERSQVDLK